MQTHKLGLLVFAALMTLTVAAVAQTRPAPGPTPPPSPPPTPTPATQCTECRVVANAAAEESSVGTATCVRPGPTFRVDPANPRRSVPASRRWVACEPSCCPGASLDGNVTTVGFTDARTTRTVYAQVSVVHAPANTQLRDGAAAWLSYTCSLDRNAPTFCGRSESHITGLITVGHVNVEAVRAARPNQLTIQGHTVTTAASLARGVRLRSDTGPMVVENPASGPVTPPAVQPVTS